MPSIQTLVPDIQRLFNSENIVVPEAQAKAFGEEIAKVIVDRLGHKTHTPSLRLSNLGTVCRRKLWYSINQPDKAEPLSASARFKFMFGDILESVLLFCATLAGHDVTRRQEAVIVDDVIGHIDAVVDGELIDVKSASTFSFRKFASGNLAQDDAFGYITQLSAYGQGLRKSKGHFLVVDKTLGNICLDSHELRPLSDGTVADTRAMLQRPDPPARQFSDEADGKSGNRKLGIACSYCDFKLHCWPNLRIYQYSTGPRFLTEVQREPRVNEG